jgi:hypothetical protein
MYAFIYIFFCTLPYYIIWLRYVRFDFLLVLFHILYTAIHIDYYTQLYTYYGHAAYFCVFFCSIYTYSSRLMLPVFVSSLGGFVLVDLEPCLPWVSCLAYCVLLWSPLVAELELPVLFLSTIT